MRTDGSPRRPGRSNGTSRPKLLIVGVDAGSPTLFRQWSETGDLPNVRRLMDRGRVCNVENPYALEAGAVWPVFHSGLMPGRQPQYDGRRVFVPEDYSVRWYAPDETPPTVWRQLSDQGVECLLIDPPYVDVDPGIRGTMIVDWGGHVPADGRRFDLRTQPSQLADEVLDLVGPDPAGNVECDLMSPESIEDHRRFRDVYLERTASKGSLAAHMLRHKSWDVALVVTSDLHCTGHHLWHVNDAGHPRYSARLEAALGEPLRDCYRAFDQALGKMLEAVGPDTTIMLFASHGMGPCYSGTGLLDRILLRLDRHWHTAATNGQTLRRARGAASIASTDLLRRRLQALWTHLPDELSRHLGPVHRYFEGMPRSSDRRFFEVHANDATGGVRLNLRGREGRGIVEPEIAEDLIRYLTRELSAVENATTGAPLIEDVIATRDWYRGPHVDGMPDLLVRWNRDAPIRSVRSPAIGELSHEYLDNRTGGHTPDGLCVIVGPGIAPGEEGADMRTADFAASIATFYGCDIGSHDGCAAVVGRAEQPA